MINRRNFIKTSAAAGIGSLMLPNMLKGKEQLKSNIGLQLWSIKESLKIDFEKNIAQVAKIGYKELEFPGYFDYTAKDLKKILDSHGLKAVGNHLQIDVANNDDLKKQIDFAHELGVNYLVVPWMDAKVLDDFKKASEKFNKAAEKCKAANIQFCYHNHDFEFKKMDGKMCYDILLKETDPALVKMEMDLYWVVKGGQDPLAYFKNNPGRFLLWHVKDMAKNAEKNNTEIGNGSINFPSIFAKAQQAGMKHFFVEQENYDIDQMKSIEISYKYLKNL